MKIYLLLANLPNKEIVWLKDYKVLNGLQFSLLQDRIYRQYVLEAMRSSERLRNSVSGNNAAAGGVSATSTGHRASGVPNVCLMARNRKVTHFQGRTCRLFMVTEL